MALKVRALNRADVAAVAELLAAGSLTPEAEDPNNVEAYWRAAEENRQRLGEVFVAVLDGEVVGVAQVMVFPHLQHTGGRCAELESVHVRADHRSEGIGSALLAAAENLARERGCYRIQLTSRNVRVDAHRFYEANGYGAVSQGFKKPLD